MSTVYVPHVIESVEQAEKLPIGTVATFTSSVLTTAAVKNAGPLPGWWSGDERVPVGPRWTALVPVEAQVTTVDEKKRALLETVDQQVRETAERLELIEKYYAIPPRSFRPRADADDALEDTTAPPEV